MIGYTILKNAVEHLLETDLVKKVYHTTQIWDQDGERYPVYKDGDELVYVGVDDTKFMSCYIRQLNGFAVTKTNPIGSSGRKEYQGRVLNRIVFFNDFEERNHDELTIKLLAITFNSKIELVRIMENKDEILREEAKVKNFTFGGLTFYRAIDFYVLLKVQDACDLDVPCGEWENPITLKT